MSTPRLIGDARAFTVDSTVVFEAPGATLLADGAGPWRLLPLVDGVRTVADLAAAVPDAEVPELLGRLERSGRVLVDGAGETGAARAALGVSAAVSEVGVTALGIRAATVDAYAAALRRLGIAVDEGAETLVVLCADLLDEGLLTINAERLDRPWTIVRPGGRVVALGPLLGRPGAACWACIAHRLQARAPLRSWQQSYAPEAPAPEHPPVLELAAQLAAVHTLRLMVGDATSLTTLDLATLRLERHAVARRPQCPTCGDPLDSARPVAPLQLRETVPARRTGGGLRTAAVTAMLADLATMVDDVTGLVGEPRESEPPPDASYVAEHAFAAAGPSLLSLRRRIALRSGGKGSTPDEARASAVCEALERYCGTWQGDEPSRRAAFADVADEAVRPERLQLFSSRQYERRDQLNATAPPAQQVPLPFDDRHTLAWTPAWSLTRARARLIPATLCWYGHPDAAAGFGTANSNGCAAGACVEEAVLQGLLELVERDAVAVWWFNRLCVPGVDVDSFESEYATAWRRRRTAAGMRTWVLDLTHDLGVPVLAAIAVSSGGEILYGFGAHPDPEIALTRALTEVNQSLPYLRRSRRAAGARTDLTGWLDGARVERLPWLRPAEAPPRARPAFADPGTSDVAAHVRALVAGLAARDLEVLVVDQSRPDVPLSVVRTIVPGLRHFWRRLAPGRLYAVPVALGLRARPLAESELNEWDIYF